MIKNFKWLLVASLAFVACNNEDEVTIDSNSSDGKPLTAGSANFSKYVALGDSFAAGFSDGALFIEAQKGAYPNILAQQFALAGGGAFTTPFMADNVGGFLGSAIYTPRLYLVPPKTPEDSPAPSSVALDPYNQKSSTTFASLGSTYNNMGIPGAKSFHLLAPGYGSAAGNPYFARFATNAGTTVIADAIAQSPTFFSLWIGGNDVLGYATSGGVGVNQTGNLNPATYGANDITDPAVFAQAYNGLVTGLTGKSPKGVVANLPYVNTLPYFTAVPVTPLTAKVLGNKNEAVGIATIIALNTQLYSPLNSALTFLGAGDRINLLSTTKPNPLLIKDETLPNLAAQLTAVLTPSLGAQRAGLYAAIYGQARQTTKADLVVLPTQSVIGTSPTAVNSGLGIVPPDPLNKFGITFPLLDQHVLIPSEIAEIKTATDAYNTTIQSIADAKGLAFFDAKAVMNQLSTSGITTNGFTTTATYVTGGAFSLDGVHPSPRGYALIANKFIEAINSKYGSNLKGVDLSKYRIMFPPNPANF